MLYAVYFSPNGGTEKCVKMIADCLDETYEVIDLTPARNRRQKYVFSAEDRLVVGMPVYCGRIPQLTDLLTSLEGNGARAIAAVIYGNREIDDALLELRNDLRKQALQPVAGMVMLAPHCFTPAEVCPDRPDENDRKMIRKFVQKVDWNRPAADILQVPGQEPYKPYPPSFPFLPETADGCTHCGTCMKVCPVDAISAAGTDPDRCIRCAACINSCPEHCRIINHPGFFATQNKLRALAPLHKEPRLYL